MCAILNTSPGGNGLIILAHQLIAAKLNVANGATSISAIADADALIGSLVVGSAYLAASETSVVALTLDNYNNGADIIPHCE